MMRFLSTLLNVLLAAAPDNAFKKTTWYIDGNNLMGHKGTPRTREAIAEKLAPIQQESSRLSVILVWDGHRGQGETIVEPSEDDARTKSTTTRSAFQVVSLAEGMSTDDYILNQLKDMKTQYFTQHQRKQQHDGGDTKPTDIPSVQVVTADRALRRQVLAVKPIVKSVVNPVVFWKRYRPRLTGLKSDYKNEPKNPEQTY